MDHLIAAAPYALLREEIHALKFRQGYFLVPDLANLLLQALRLLSCNEETVLCPVPLHWSRRLMRGCNQAELLAVAVSATSSIPLQKVLHRVRMTGQQTRRSRSERKNAMHNAFSCSAFPGEHVILIDDVCTTGATLNACAAVLRHAGVRRIDGLVLAQG